MSRTKDWLIKTQYTESINKYEFKQKKYDNIGSKKDV